MVLVFEDDEKKDVGFESSILFCFDQCRISGYLLIVWGTGRLLNCHGMYVVRLQIRVW